METGPLTDEDMQDWRDNQARLAARKARRKGAHVQVVRAVVWFMVHVQVGVLAATFAYWLKPQAPTTGDVAVAAVMVFWSVVCAAFLSWLVRPPAPAEPTDAELQASWYAITRTIACRHGSHGQAIAYCDACFWAALRRRLSSGA